MLLIERKYKIYSAVVPKFFLALEVLMSLLYLFCILFWLEKGNWILFGILAVSEFFHVWLLITLIFTIWPRKVNNVFDIDYQPSVDIYITVVNEPIDIVRETVINCKNLNYPDFNIFILNDGRVCNYEKWSEYEKLAIDEGIKCISREIPGGAKAGNINNALKITNSDFIAVFDADHAPTKDFLLKLVPYFVDPKVAFVQSPQYYKNFLNNTVTLGSAEQQELFFGPIMTGKNAQNSAFMCGTNMIIRRKALDEVGGLSVDNIAEDFMTSLLIHQKGWKSIYTKEILAEGLAPEDFLSYCKQQFRWARGSLEILFYYNPIFNKTLNFSQKLNYFTSASYYLSGLIIIFNLITPIIFLLFGLEPLRSSTMILPTFFLPYIILGSLVLNISTNSSYTFRALAFSNGSFWIFCKALFSVVFRQKSSFEVTSKEKISGNFIKLIIPHILYFIVGISSSVYGVLNFGVNAATVTNICWIVFNGITFFPFMMAALPETRSSYIKDKIGSFFRTLPNN
jgi:cellulose synthase (UDP-forming)